MARIADAAGADRETSVLEIGPGIGALSHELCRRAGRVVAVELDKALLPILIPLFVSAFRRADELALAMECRCYHGGEGRTRLKQLRYMRLDAAAYALGTALLAAVIVLRCFGL